MPFDVWVATIAKKTLLLLFFENDCVIDQKQALETAGGSRGFWWVFLGGGVFLKENLIDVKTL